MMNSPDPWFEGRASHFSWKGLEEDGRIILLPDRVRFESSAHHVEMPFAGLELSRAGRGRVRFSHPEEADWTVIAPNSRILKHPLLTKQNELRLRARAVEAEIETIWRWKLCAIFLSVFAVVTVLAIEMGRWTMSFLVSRVPMSWERNLGDEIFAQLTKEEKVSDDSHWLDEIQTVGARLTKNIPTNQFQFRYHIIDRPDPNAFAMPGGLIVVHKGLFQVATNREQLAGVLGHEIAHVTRRHCFRQVISAAGWYSVMSVFVSDRRGFLALLGQGSALLVRQNFSREYEREADDLGSRYLLDANINPAGLLQFLQAMRLGENRSEALLPASFNSHPPTAERIAHLQEICHRSRGRTFDDLGAMNRRPNAE
jgi:predicted Zn-dependent protease